MLEGDRFRSTTTGSVWQIRQTIDCRSKNIKYLLACKRCRMQGVGSTLDFQGIGLYNDPLWDFSIMGIVQIEPPPPPPRNKEKLKQRLREFEIYWQVNLNTIKPFGMNSINEWNRIARRKYIGSCYKCKAKLQKLILIRGCNLRWDQHLRHSFTPQSI